MGALVALFHGAAVYGRVVWLIARAILRAAREADGMLDYYRRSDLIHEAWPAKGADGEPLAIRMPWYRSST